MTPRSSAFLSLCALVTALLSLAPRSAWALDEPDLDSLGQLARVIRWSGVFSSIFVIGGAWLVMRFLRRTVTTLSKRFPNRRLLLQNIATFVQFLIYVATGVTVILLSLQLNKSVLALIGGTIAVSVGFAVKDLVASFIAGIMIMIDRPFQVGDRVTFGGEYGDITAIGLRSVRLQTLDDSTVTIPNNKF
ncbi:MAG: mechanosensitive ion channel, partial [Myxococcales bacterium]|nr:mechanosensitive ion channel [Myxococcales bacterium]